MSSIFPRICLGMILAAAVSSASFQGQAEEFPGWAFPYAPPPGPSTDATPRSVPGSDLHFTDAQIHAASPAVDWFPADHAAMPPLVADRRTEKKFACAYCHMPDGGGRAENAKLAGLPEAYIERQIKAFQAGEHKPALAGWRPSLVMADMVAGLNDEDIRSVAAYFSRQKAKSFARVVESATVPQHQVGLGIMLPLPGKPVALGSRIVEMPTDVERFEHRDPHTGYIAYVPVGSIERGRKLAQSVRDRTKACATCHGVGLRGGGTMAGPPLAGRFPTYLFRQLYAFQTGARGGDAAQPMHSVVADLSQADMIALAAYAASLKP